MKFCCKTARILSRLNVVLRSKDGLRRRDSGDQILKTSNRVVCRSNRLRLPSFTPSKTANPCEERNAERLDICRRSERPVDRRTFVRLRRARFLNGAKSCSFDLAPGNLDICPGPLQRHCCTKSLPAEGFEPTRSCDHWILSPARLPIPPRRRSS